MRRLPVLVASAQAARSSVVTPYEREVRAEGVKCRKGCSHCCFYPVHVSLLEALHIRERLVDDSRWTLALREKLAESSKRTKGVRFDLWMLALIPCPFLVKDACSIYAYRPAVCRVTFSRGAPEQCHPHKIVSSTGIVPRKEVLGKIRAQEFASLRRAGVHGLSLPVSTALLLADRIANKELDVADAPTIAVAESLL